MSRGDFHVSISCHMRNQLTWDAELFSCEESKLTAVRNNGQLISEYGYDGDGKRVAEINADGTATIFIGNYFEGAYPEPEPPAQPPQPPQPSLPYKAYLPVVSKGGISFEPIAARLGTLYFYADGERIAMNKNGEVYYLYGDQLGSVSAVADADGNQISKTLYYPWGTTRHTQGISPTDYAYTGQKQVGDIYFYNARWYDPQLGRFMQADTLVPPQQGTQGFDRYAYVNNNPLRYNDPSGMRFVNTMETDGGGSTKRDIGILIRQSFGWRVEGNWTNLELETLLEAGKKFEKMISAINGGAGKSWIFANTKGTIFLHDTDASNTILSIIETVTGVRPSGVVHDPSTYFRVSLDDSGFNTYTIIHEIGHIVDNKHGPQNVFSTWAGGGPADDLIYAMGGVPEGVRFANEVNVARENMWSGVNEPYGNSATAEYFAEAFVNTVLNTGFLPNAKVGAWISNFIICSTP